MPTCKKCNLFFPNHLNINGKVRNLQKRKYCLDCSPFGKHNTRKLCDNNFNSSLKYCCRCKTQKDITEFYSKRKKIGQSSYCKICSNLQAKERQQLFKEKCVKYKGSKCEICGYSKCIGALEFHHLDRDKKDFNISNRKSHQFGEIVKNELDKCKLCCANCHREIHSMMK